MKDALSLPLFIKGMAKIQIKIKEAIVPAYTKRIRSKLKISLRFMFTISVKINAGSVIEKTTFEETVTKLSLIIFSRFKAYPKSTIRKTGATRFKVKIKFCTHKYKR